MERRGSSIAPEDLQERINLFLQDERIPLTLRKAMARAAIVQYDDGGATSRMVRQGWQSTPIQDGVTLHVVDDGWVFIEIVDDNGARRSFSPLPHDSLGYSLALQDWVPLDQLK